MCRFLVYMSLRSKPTLLADVVVWPDHSIIKQSYDCKERAAHGTFEKNLPTHCALPPQINADGFGIGWYSPSVDTIPCVFTSPLPAWNNRNLARLSSKITSPLIMAHVRAASPGSLVTDSNCHPFVHGRYMFMHNGMVAQFQKIQRKLLSVLREDLYQSIEGTTDSEHCFALFLQHLIESIQSTSTSSSTSTSTPLPSTQVLQQPITPAQLLAAVNTTITHLCHLLHDAGVREPSLLNFAVTDGECVILTRFVSEPSICHAATLYFAAGTDFQRCHDGLYRMAQIDRREEVVIVASERLTSVKEDWCQVPNNHAVVITNRLNVLLSPIKMEQRVDETA